MSKNFLIVNLNFKPKMVDDWFVTRGTNWYKTVKSGVNSVFEWRMKIPYSTLTYFNLITIYIVYINYHRKSYLFLGREC